MAFLAPLGLAALAGGGAAAAGAGLGTALAIGSAALTGFSAFQQNKYQASIARQNAKIAVKNAEREAESSQLENLRNDREYAAQMSSALAEQSVSGLDVLGRSQLRVRDSIATNRDLASKDIAKQGAYKVEGLMQESANFRSEAKMLKSKAVIDLASSLIGGAASVKKTGWKK